MFIVLNRGQVNMNALAGEDLTNGMAITIRQIGAQLKAFKSTVAGEKIDGIATISTTDPNFNRFPQTLDDFLATQTAFSAHYDAVKAGIRVLLEQGIGTAQTDQLVADTYVFGDRLVSNGDGRLKKTSGASQHVVAVVRQNKIIKVAGDRLDIEYMPLAQVYTA